MNQEEQPLTIPSAPSQAPSPAASEEGAKTSQAPKGTEVTKAPKGTVEKEQKSHDKKLAALFSGRTQKVKKQGRELPEPSHRPVKLADGIVRQNVVLMSGLFAAPVIGAALNFNSALAVCVAFSLITFFSVTLCYFLPRRMVFTLRIVLYAIVAAVLYIPVCLLLDRLFPITVIEGLGIYLPIMITNPLILSKTESRFYFRSFPLMLKDLLGFILGFDLACLLVGVIRDILVNNQLGTLRVKLPFQVPALGTVFGGFILVGTLAGLLRAVYNRRKNKQSKRRGGVR